MKFDTRIISMMLVMLFGSTAALAQLSHPNWDSEAIEVLRAMDAYTESMEQFEVTLESYTDHELAGQIVSNPSTSRITVDRSGSLLSVTQGVLRKTEIYFHDGVLSVFSDEHDF